MVAYRRNLVPGGTFFFTVNLQERNKSYLTENVEELREAFRSCKAKLSFQIDAIVILPDHLHCIMTLPPDDTDYAARWKSIKSTFTKSLIKKGVELLKDKNGRYNLWQRRYWEHTIRDSKDFERHVDYIHYNPIKHKYVKVLSDWPYSSFHRYVDQNIIPANWGDEIEFSNSNFGEAV